MLMDSLNQKLQRNAFMPFAPAVLEAEYDSCFLGGHKGRHAAQFMTMSPPNSGTDRSPYCDPTRYPANPPCLKISWGQPAWKFARSKHTGGVNTLFGDGSSSRDYTYVSDIVDGITLALEKFASNFSIYNLAGESQVSLMELVAALERHTGKKANVQRSSMQRDSPVRRQRRSTAGCLA